VMYSSISMNGCATSPSRGARLSGSRRTTTADETTGQLEPLRQRIFDEIKARTKETDLSVTGPTRRLVVLRPQFEGKQYGVQCRCPVTDPTDWNPPVFDEHTDIPGEHVLLDENVEAEGTTFLTGRRQHQSPTAMCWLTPSMWSATNGYTLRFRDFRTGEQYPDEIVGIGAGAAWATDNRTVYYVHARRGLAPRYRLATSACFGSSHREGVSRIR